MSNWRIYNRALIPLTPPHIEVNTDGIEEEIKKKDAYFARWTSEFDSEKAGEFWYVICDEELEISDYSRNTRSKIRRGLKNCEIRLVNKKYIIDYGYDSYKSAFINYKTHLKCKSISFFQEELYNLSDQWEFWGIFHQGRMIGYSQNKLFSDCCDYSTIKIHPEFLRFYASFALFYTMNKYYLNDKKLRYVSDGARSISHETNIQDFLMSKFKFRRAYCKMHISYHKRIKILIRFIFPIRFIISRLNFGIFKKLNILILQEKILRSYE